MIDFTLIFLAAIFEFIDSGIGMMYGTALTPLLILLGYGVKAVIPSILLSQAVGGFVASFRHHQKKNAEFNINSSDFKIASFIIALGIVAVIVGAFIGKLVSTQFLNTYISILCIIIGLTVLIKKAFKFSWLKVAAVGIISAFNKALSGGGFGPIVSSGLVISGQENKKAIGITDFAEAPICLIAFLVWVILNGFPSWSLIIPLTIGAAVGGFFGPAMLSKIKSTKKIVITMGILTLLEGTYLLLKTYIF